MPDHVTASWDMLPSQARRLGELIAELESSGTPLTNTMHLEFILRVPTTPPDAEDFAHRRENWIMDVIVVDDSIEYDEDEEWWKRGKVGWFRITTSTMSNLTNKTPREEPPTLEEIKSGESEKYFTLL